MARRRVLVGAALLLLAVPAAVAAEARFEVSGVATVRDETLGVRVDVRNTGDRAASPLTVTGELLGEHREARFASLTPGQIGSVHLTFAVAVPRPGVYSLPLLLEYPEEGPRDAAGNPPLNSQRAYLLLALGAAAEPAFKVEAPGIAVDTRGPLRVSLESLDGQPHRARVEVLTARGVRTEGPPVEVEVPARGKAAATLTVMRSGAPRGTRHGLLVVAGAVDGPLERTTVTTTVVEIAPTPALLPVLRVPLILLALALLAAAAGLEVWAPEEPAE